jgi:hypothetical protein
MPELTGEDFNFRRHLTRRPADLPAMTRPIIPDMNDERSPSGRGSWRAIDCRCYTSEQRADADGGLSQPFPLCRFDFPGSSAGLAAICDIEMGEWWPRVYAPLLWPLNVWAAAEWYWSSDSDVK